MERRKFLTGAAVAGAATSLAAPSVAQGKIEMAIVATWPRETRTAPVRVAKSKMYSGSSFVRSNH